MTTTTPATAKPVAAHKSFMVYDDNGKIWPPGFKSEIFSPGGRFCLLMPAEVRRAEEAAKRTKEAEDRDKIVAVMFAEADARSGLPALPAGPGKRKEPKTRAEDRQLPFYFRRTPDGGVGIAEAAWRRLVALGDGGAVSCEQLSAVIGMSPGDVRAYMVSATEARIVNAEVRGKVHVYTLGAALPYGVGQ